MTHQRSFARLSRLCLCLSGAGLALSLLAAAPPAPIQDDAPTALTDTPEATPEPTAPTAPSETSEADPATVTSDGAALTPNSSETPSEATASTTPSPSGPTETAPPAETLTPAATEWPTATDLASPTLADASATPDPSSTPTAPAPSPTDALVSDTPSATASSAETPTPTPIPTLTPTSSSTPTSPAPDPRAYSSGAVLINEVAWAGTEASTSDEWIELWNPGADPVDLTGWLLIDGNDIDRSLSGSIAAFGFFLLERTDDSTVADVPADLIYTGSLANAGETLTLLDPSGQPIDTANAAGGAWPAGATSPRASMERHGALDLLGNWTTFGGAPFASDAGGHPVLGTPRQPNSPSAPPPTSTPTPTPTAPWETPYPEGALHINEVAWAGTEASSSDEWIELINPGAEAIDLGGWTLSDGNDLDVALHGSISAGEFFLLERTDDSSVADVSADQIYSGALSNIGESLSLTDPTGAEIDSANGDGGSWPAGSEANHASMERAAGGGWQTYTGFSGVAHDADGNSIRGTPRSPNSVLLPTPGPTWIPGRVVINEVLIRPHYDWEGAGGITTADEFIEIYNRGPNAVNLRGWILDDYVVGGSSPFVLPSISLEPGEYVALFRSRTHIALNDDGDSIRLSAPDGRLVDKIRYLSVRAYNLSYGRLPDGGDVLVYGLWPTPGDGNILFVEPTPTAVPKPLVCPQPRLGHLAALVFRPEPCP